MGRRRRRGRGWRATAVSAAVTNEMSDVCAVWYIMSDRQWFGRTRPPLCIQDPTRLTQEETGVEVHCRYPKSRRVNGDRTFEVRAILRLENWQKFREHEIEEPKVLFSSSILAISLVRIAGIFEGSIEIL